MFAADQSRRIIAPHTSQNGRCLDAETVFERHLSQMNW